ncbi:MAG: NAD-dependent epimerase/dehydratase family protein [Akkermansiaceae bacterium]|nr:NAD-dependent epimerase/dehydratase family protein [Armatimonadota bacterium]
MAGPVQSRRRTATGANGVIAFVTGATGCVGYALCRRLLTLASFTEVRVLARSNSPDVPDGCRVFVGSLDDTSVLQTACEGVDVIFHAAAQVHTPDAPPSDFERVNVGGTTKLLQAATGANVPRFVYFSTVAVYGEDTPLEGISEDSPPAPVTPYAQTKLRGELLVQEWATRTGGVGVLLRLATVYGARDRGNMARMMEAIRRGRFVLPGAGQNCKTCVAVETVAGIAANAGLFPDAPDGLPVVVADPHGAYPLQEIADTMATIITGPGRTRYPRLVPLRLLRHVAQTTERVWSLLRPGKTAPITAQQVDRLAASNVYRIGRMNCLLAGFTPPTLAEGLRGAYR